MPIFAYRCESCGFEKDVLQKRSDPPLEECPSCGSATFRKQVSAPAFQLKGSGWYVTDFRDNSKSKGGDTGKPSAAKPDAASSASSDTSSGSDKPSSTESSTAASKPAESSGGTKAA